MPYKIEFTGGRCRWTDDVTYADAGTENVPEIVRNQLFERLLSQVFHGHHSERRCRKCDNAGVVVSFDDYTHDVALSLWVNEDTVDKPTSPPPEPAPRRRWRQLAVIALAVFAISFAFGFATAAGFGDNECTGSPLGQHGVGC